MPGSNSPKDREGTYALPAKKPTDPMVAKPTVEAPPGSPLSRASSSRSGAGLQRKQSIMGSGNTFKFSAALDAAENEAVADHDSIERIRLSTKRFMTRSSFGKWYENIFLVISILSSLEYIWETYLNVSSPVDRQQLAVLDIVELIVAILFTFDWGLNCFMADHKLLFMTSFFSMVDLFSVIPIYATVGRVLPDVSRITTLGDALLYAMFALNTTRILRALRVRRKFLTIEDAVDRFLAEISLNIIVMILFFAAAIQFIEFEYQDNDFHTWIWYIWVTISTVGYGDIFPITTQGRIAAMFIIGFSIITIPKMTNELLEKMALQSVYARAVYSPKTRNSKHVVICGDLTSTALNDFFEELFHEDHENSDLYAVILLPHPPSVEIIFLMRDSQFFLSLTYLQGSALLDSDLKRAKAEASQAIFIMTNKFSAYPDEEDAKSILLNLSIKRYLSYFDIAQKLYCMQLIRPQNRRHLSRDMDSELKEQESNLVVCLNEIKMGVMAKAVMYPGANALLMNLISSFSEEPLDGDDADSAKDDASGISSRAWLREYQKGCDWEIYTTSLSRIFEGAKFSELSLALYEKIGVVLLGLQITENHFGGQTKLFLNPADYIIPSQEEYVIEAFVIAQNKASSDLSFSNNGSNGSNSSSAARDIEAGFTAVQRMMVQHHQPRKKTMDIGGANNHGHSSGGDRKFSVFADQGPKKLNLEEYRMRQMTKMHEEANVAEIKEAQTKAAKKKTSKWQSLKRSALLEKKVESFSYQEILSQLEDKHNEQHYYLRESPVEIKDVLIRTNVTDEIPFVNNHTIIVGKGFKNLFDLIRPLRAKYLGPLRYIVLVTPVDIPPDVWRRIAMFDGVVVVRGSALEESNLRRAGIFRATQVVVLADGSDEVDRKGSGMEALVDSDAIFCYQCVKRMNPDAHVVVEIVNTSNINYIDTEVNQSQSGDYKFTSQFAAGTLFTTSLLDSIVCQAYYNPSIIKILNKLLSGVDEIDRVELSNQAHDRADAVQGGDQESSDEEADADTFNINAAASASASFKSKKSSVHGRSTLSNIHGSCLYQMKLPEQLDKNTYGKLYQHLAHQGIIPLGILRGTFANLKIGPKHNRFPYVYTNPEKDTELFKCDRVFVLSTKPVQSVGKLEVKDWILNIQMQQSQNKSKPGESPLVRKNRKSIETTSMESLDITQKKLEARVSKMSSDLNKKLGNIMSLLEQTAAASRVATALGPLQETDSSDDGRRNRDTVVAAYKRQSTSESIASAESSPRYPYSRRQSVDTTGVESTRTNDASSPRANSRRSSVGSVDMPFVAESQQQQQQQQQQQHMLLLPGSPPTSTTGILRKKLDSGISADSADAAPSTGGTSKKRHSFSTPISVSITIDQDKSVAEQRDLTPLHPNERAEITAALAIGANAEVKSRPASAYTESSLDSSAASDIDEETLESTASPTVSRPASAKSTDHQWTSSADSQKSDVSKSDAVVGEEKGKDQGSVYDSEAELKETSALLMKLKPDKTRPKSAGDALSSNAAVATAGFSSPQRQLRSRAQNAALDSEAAVGGPPIALTQSNNESRLARIRSGKFFNSPQESPLSRSRKIAPTASTPTTATPLATTSSPDAEESEDA